jgi:diguanylate cyclase (GGDEF)-like protein
VSEQSELNRYQRALEVAEQRGGPSEKGGKGSLLTFESGIEMDYLEHRRTESLPLQRFGLVLSVVFYVSFFAVDALFWQRYQENWLLVPVLYISSMANLILLALTWVKAVQPALRWLAALTVLINAIALSFSSAIGQKMGVPIPPEAPVIQTVYTLFLLNLTFRFAAPVATITVAMFALLHSMVDMDSGEYFYRCFMMVVAGTVGALACYLTERVARLAWLRARLLRELSEHDSLTGLYNHRMFYQRGEQLIRQARREKCSMAVLVIDVDHFKDYNDQYGHLAGDEALRQVATALSKSARRPFDIAARIGGEEFALLLFNISAEDAYEHAEEVRNLVRGLALAGGRRVTVSLGVAMTDGISVIPIEALIGEADAALYRAKSAGRDQVAT